MKQLVRCVVTLNIFLFINIVSSAEQIPNPLVTISPRYESTGVNAWMFEIKKPFTLLCNITWNSKDEPANFKVVWKKDNVAIDTSLSRFKTRNSGIKYELDVKDTVRDDIGTYSCGVYQNNQLLDEKHFNVISKFIVHVQKFVNVIEGDKLILHCGTKGEPTPIISWSISYPSINDSEIINLTETSGRFKLVPDTDHHVNNSVLEIEDMQFDDSGLYTCIGTSPINGMIETKMCTVKIKDKYAALWPFLGICIEVLVLCVVIFIYEKKRNKTELEESDTDQSPDQKNTPDHGKDSNLRHRQ